MPLSEEPKRPEEYEFMLERMKLMYLMELKRYRLVFKDLKDMANGGDANGVRQKNYPFWTDDDFKALNEELEAYEKLRPAPPEI